MFLHIIKVKNIFGGEINKLTVVIVTRDHAEFINECLSSVEREFETGTKIFIVDVGSTDRTPEETASFQSNSKKLVEIIQISRNSTPLDALRSLIGRIETPFVSMISGDDYFLPGYGDLCRGLIENIELNTVFNFAHLIINEKSEQIGMRVPKWSTNAAQDRKRLLYSNPGTTAGCILPWKILVDSCLSDPQFNLMIEDYYFHIRLVDKVSFVGVQLPVVAYRRHATNLSSPVSNRKYFKSLGVCVRLSWNMSRGAIEKMMSFFLLFRWARNVPVNHLNAYLRGFLTRIDS